MKNNILANETNDGKLKSLKKLAVIVYICQVLTFGLAGLPLFIGLVINYIKRAETEGTWLESHFDWQIKSAWITLAGLALFGLTMGTGISIYILIPTILLLIYRIIFGWIALNSNKPVKE